MRAFSAVAGQIGIEGGRMITTIADYGKASAARFRYRYRRLTKLSRCGRVRSYCSPRLGPA